MWQLFAISSMHNYLVRFFCVWRPTKEMKSVLEAAKANETCGNATHPGFCTSNFALTISVNHQHEWAHSTFKWHQISLIL